MRLCPACLSVALVSAALIFGALPASAKPAESQEYSFSVELDRLAATLMSTGQRALDTASNVAARLIHDGKDALDEAKTDATQRFQEFRETLNERKAQLGKVGEDAASQLTAWTHDAAEALHRFRDWLRTDPAPDEPIEIPV